MTTARLLQPRTVFLIRTWETGRNQKWRLHAKWNAGFHFSQLPFSLYSSFLAGCLPNSGPSLRLCAGIAWEIREKQ